MSWVIDPPVILGPVAFAAISEVETCVRGDGRYITGVGRKRPVLFLQCSDGRIDGVGIDGNSYDEAKIELRYPEAIDRLRALLDDTS
ncbi:hypothetical protein AADZ90_010965 [Aestuariibius sp. 2305UL40-4]|uniref:hypothetical protein n=1 Tax=Aestuariibius violaceus TaxID=3234132 RepID=UPI00345EF0DC